MTAIPSAPVSTDPGTILASKYRVERVLGHGGMGIVVEARHLALEERVALKFLLPGYAHQPEAAARFLREARAAAKIKSEHVARVADVGTLDTGAPYMVMEYLEGADLSKVLSTGGVLRIEDAIDYVIQGCEAIAEAHGYGIVHRDIKPANLFLGKRPNGMPIVKVLDFGISKVAEATDNLTKTTAAIGSALYMSPEQMAQSRSVDNRTDIYALGVSLYELLAGRQPFCADTLPQLCAAVFTGTPEPLRSARPDVPEELARVLEKAYARDRAARYETVADFVNALAPFAPQRSQELIESIAGVCGRTAARTGSSAPIASTNTGGLGTGAQVSHVLPSLPAQPNTGNLTGRPIVSPTTPPAGTAPSLAGGRRVALFVAGGLALAAGAFLVTTRFRPLQTADVTRTARPASPAIGSAAPVPSAPLDPVSSVVPRTSSAPRPSATINPSATSSSSRRSPSLVTPRDHHRLHTEAPEALPRPTLPAATAQPANTVGF